MPTVNISHNELINKIGDLTVEQVDKLCWSYGLELDEVTSEYEIVKNEQGEEKAKGLSEELIYKIDVPANRYDLLCVEGLTRALMIFEQKMICPLYDLKPKHANVILNVNASTLKVRPYVVAAILRNITFDETRYKSFIQLQEKLHQNIGKKRHIVSIGTHNLDNIKAPFLYTTKRPSNIKFIPLNENKEFNAEELMIHYSKESHLKPYLSIIRDFEEYPVIYDSEGVLLSMPPIINGDHSKITLLTKNVFIEITGTNLHKITVSLDTMVTMFSEYCDDKFSIEPVEIRGSDGSSHQYPELSYRLETISVDYNNRTTGTPINGEEVAKLLDRMCLSTEIIKGSNGSVLTVKIPPTRHDIIHRCDIAEDVAIAYGYEKIPEHKPYGGYFIGGDTNINKLSDEIRYVMAIEGFTEGLSFVLCSRDDVSTKLGKDISLVPAIHISNPKTLEFQVARTTLLPGILNTIYCNQHLPLPLRLFEVQDIVLLDPCKDVGASNNRRVCAVHYGNLPEFEMVYNVMTSLMTSLGCEYIPGNKKEMCVPHGDNDQLLMSPRYYEVQETEDESVFLTGRSYKIVLFTTNKVDKSFGKRDIGIIGIIKPTILKNFNIKKGLASIFEIDIEPFL